MFRNKTGSKASKAKKIYFIKIILDWTIETGKTQFNKEYKKLRLDF